MFRDNKRRSINKFAEKGKLEELKKSLNEGGNVNELVDGFAPLHLACQAGNDSVVKFLLQQENIDINLLAR